MRITTEMTKAAYKLAADVYHGKIQEKHALDTLVTKYGMNRGSASDYIVNFKRMMEGKNYKRTNNSEATDYFFTNILNDYGIAKLRNALSAANEHVDYYESLGRGNLNSIRSIIAKHEKIAKLQPTTDYPDELQNPESLFEGIKKTITVNTYERNPAARKKCIEHYGTNCTVCGFSFGASYGDIGTNFIHVHHLTQISDIGTGYEINPIEDLRPVCPNCHAMLHRKNPPFTIEEIKKHLTNGSTRTR